MMIISLSVKSSHRAQDSQSAKVTGLRDRLQTCKANAASLMMANIGSQRIELMKRLMRSNLFRYALIVLPQSWCSIGQAC